MLNGLNEAQKLAVTTINGPVIVMAGAGSGKTKVLTHRIAYILDQTGISPYSILAVTFTNKAAAEMKKRVEDLIGVDTRYMWISTFHSFCARLLRLEVDKYLPPYNHNFSIIDEEDSLKIVKDIFKKLDIENYKPKYLRELISKAKNFIGFNLRDPYLKSVYDKVSEEYEYFLKENNMLDFDDLIIKTIDLLKNNPEVLQKYQDKFAYILIDEFQDTNDLQYKLVFMLANRYQNIFVVGDDFQSIYSFRGAKIENIKRFRDDFQSSKLILLEENYRSTEEILNLANQIIEHNPNQIKKVMFSNNKNGMVPFYYEAASDKSEALFVIDKINRFHIDGDSYSDFAIMYRTNYISRVFEDALIKAQIPYQIFGGLSFFARKEIKDMVAYMRIIVNSDDDFSFNRIINEPKRKIGPALLEKLNKHAYDLKVSLFDAIPSYNGSGVGVQALKDFYKTIISIREELNNYPLKNLIDILLDETGYRTMLLNEDPEHERINNIFELKNVLKETDELVDGDNFAKLNSLLNDLSLRSEYDEAKDIDCVTLTTFHQAKGLEFKNVFMVAMEEGVFPSEYHLDDLDLDEERRVCYVGITRAKERLYISCSKYRRLYGQSEAMLPSRFIKEMGTKYLKNISADYSKKSQIDFSKLVDKSITAEDYKLGDKVIHNVFGKGIVVGVAENALKVAFPSPTGIKTLIKNHPSYHKI